MFCNLFKTLEAKTTKFMTLEGERKQNGKFLPSFLWVTHIHTHAHILYIIIKTFNQLESIRLKAFTNIINGNSSTSFSLKLPANMSFWRRKKNVNPLRI